ncbi:putative beta-galactosidase [Aureobasidium namibiae CBS 147.97]|uniref:Beta-galactosidase n=1 Tax=Aureobasidium namibiae CBS 147.97 TaxID=1043004 RepID=A0A074WUX3_9PEZI|nr:putative beta-galactosidase [Aureobasidium namibiae CBS 147.97]KEQ73527.1 putative beta-galactosidase [Aureobasidium namibiae CBS 147.97]UPP54610.1 beta galactosidase G [Aureobasidium sp.]
MVLGKTFMKAAALVAGLAITSDALALRKPNLNELIKPYKRDVGLLQDLVTWDEHSLFVRGERVMIYSGEFHPFRLPVPSLWLDVFQKIKALGYNAVSFYVDWALVEGKQGDFTAEGIFAWEPFFEAAQEAGIYLIARPGPYINAEVSGGGFPGWLARNPGIPRTRDPRFLEATDNYSRAIGEIIAKAQITNGGPIILYQPENEYSQAVSSDPEFPDQVYMAAVEKKFRDAGIIVPSILNDAYPHGYFAPGTGPGAVDIYGHDSYPLGFDCANPTTWPNNSLPTYFGDLHAEQSPSTPYSILEFQGGSFDPWGGSTFEKCGVLLNSEFQRVFYKNDFSYGLTIFNIYMTYGGTNWGNLGHPGGYTSYDYAAVIAEDRSVSREKYSEAKLEANFLQASPAYLTAIPQNNTHANGSYTDNPDIAVTALFGNRTNFFVVRHAVFNSYESTQFKLTLPTSQGNITIPQLNGSLVLNGRDSKFAVTDYDAAGTNLLYSSAEIFTQKSYGDKQILLVYAGFNENHELALTLSCSSEVLEGSGLNIVKKKGTTIIGFKSSSERRVVKIGELFVYILDRNDAYNYWVLDLPSSPTSAAVVKAGYLLRTVEVSGNSLHLTGDINATTEIEVIGGAPAKLTELTFNGESIKFAQDSCSGVVTGSVAYNEPSFSLPDLSTVGWKVIDSLPEIASSYDDSLWTNADLTYSNNTQRNLTTSVSLYGQDYGYNGGSLLFRGHFTATGSEDSIYLQTQGGSAFGMSAWLNGTFLGSARGIDAASNANSTFSLPNVASGSSYVLTVLIDHMGLQENGQGGSSEMKTPRGILNYSLAGRNASALTWKLTGNLHGEDYEDRTRGPLNEGGLYAERQGYHLPGAPTSGWTNSTLGPMAGVTSPGVSFYATTFDLDMPAGYDIPISISFSNATSSSNGSATVAYRSQIFVNGYQFGKYVSNIGPQDVFPVPEGIFNYHGPNYFAVSLWALDEGGAKISNLSLVAGPVIQSGYGPVSLSPMTGWSKREGAY